MKFTPEQKVLNDLFGNDIIYVIPEYQRPYSWDCIGKSDKNNQVNVMWQDLIDFFESADTNDYFMGSMVVIGNDNARTYEVVDGQQRLTTLALLFVSIKCFLLKIKSEDKIYKDPKHDELVDFINEVILDIENLVFNKKKLGSLTQEKKVRINRSSGFDYDAVLKTAMECGNISQMQISDATPEQREVSERYFKNLSYLVEQLSNKFLANDVLNYENASTLNKFIEFLKNRVTVIRIEAPSVHVAFQIFEILNNRGLPLSNKDLFRNFIIKEFDAAKSQNPAVYKDLNPTEKWRELESDLTPEFLSRYVESRKGRKQQLSAFNDLEQEIYKEFSDSLTKSKIELFYQDIKTNLSTYRKIINNDFSNIDITIRINFLLHSENTSYIINLLMAVFRNVGEEREQLALLKKIELYILYIIVGPSKHFKSAKIYDAIKELNSNNVNNALQLFELSKDEKNEIKEFLKTGRIADNDIAKLLISRYFWSKAVANTDDDVVTQELDYEKATLEHIIPQHPDSNTNWTRDFSDQFRKDYTYRLGNMTLLTQRKNSSAKNYDFEKKRSTYTKTKLALTKEIASADMSESFIKKRHDEIVDTLLEELSL